MRRLTSSQWSAWCLTCKQVRAYSQLGPAAAPLIKDELPEVPVEVAALVRRRTLGTIQVPDALTDAIEAAAAASSTRSSKLQRKQTQQLTDALKQLSRTPGKGGTTMSLIDANSNTTNNQHSKRSRKGLSAKQTLRSLRNSTPVGMSSPALDTTQDSGSDDETFWDEGKAAGDALGTTFGGASIAGGEREPAVHSSPEYDSTKVAAYASSRMPACYAVLFRVFDELHLHLPHFSPSTMLDFGSGPGTAIWAAREVWERYPQQVTAVEPSAAMRDLAVELQHAISKQHGPGRPACSIQWRRQLHPTMLPSKRSKLQQTNRQSYDLVVASYVLTEMRSDAERQQAVDMLWRQTKDVLVLLEPGTPSGSSYVRHARTQILEAGKAQNQQAASQQGVLKQPAEAGAYVVAPCPHDGQCPMEGTRSWCHFAQRFQRSDLQRRHKVLSGGHGARTYQDERFSYVVLRRGPRPGPETVPDLTVARQRQVDAPDAVQRAIEAGELHPALMYRNRVLLGVVFSQHVLALNPHVMFSFVSY
ncbi:hypothetical protein ABBQ32_009284 [Trebouxia sp. C0010 RCD-2024]